MEMLTADDAIVMPLREGAQVPAACIHRFKGPTHGAPVHPPRDRVVLCQAHLCSEHPWCSAEAEPASRWDEIPRPKPRSGLHIALDEVALRFWAVAKTRRAKLFSPQRLCVLRGDGAADPAERLREAVREEKMGEKPLLCTHPPPLVCATRLPYGPLRWAETACLHAIRRLARWRASCRGQATTGATPCQPGSGPGCRGRVCSAAAGAKTQGGGAAGADLHLAVRPAHLTKCCKPTPLSRRLRPSPSRMRRIIRSEDSMAGLGGSVWLDSCRMEAK
ncbi:hypothetical protein LdCL_360030700 [Leishmania donovani]|uniref:Uncharacterized protein n=1 Tax=Leishmania donovani TaxID=5661 RepID=A0A3Q8IJC9_LEIDO|nr:hypothetical protein LdCL_360030700 [Leishmania donovani]